LGEHVELEFRLDFLAGILADSSLGFIEDDWDNRELCLTLFLLLIFDKHSLEAFDTPFIEP